MRLLFITFEPQAMFRIVVKQEINGVPAVK